MCHGPWSFGFMVDASIPNEEMITECEYRVPAAPVNRRKTHNVIPVRSLFIRGRYFSIVSSQASFGLAALSLLSAVFAVASTWIALPQHKQERSAVSRNFRKDYRQLINREILPSTRTTRCHPPYITTDGNAANSSAEVDNLPLSIPDFAKYELMIMPARGKLETHAIYGSLWKSNRIERYDVYRARRQSQLAETTSTTDESMPDVVAIITVGENLDGHAGIVHGGIIALIIDDVLGFGYYAVLMDEWESLTVNTKNFVAIKDYTDVVAVTANLNINFRAPMPSGSTFVVEATLVSDCNASERRANKNKFHWDVQVKSLDRSITFCQASSLYVIPKQASKE